MRVVIQRVKSAAVAIAGETRAGIGMGLLIYLGIEQADEPPQAEWLAGKIAGLRIFSDEAGLMNLSVNDVKGDILLVSQFTLHAYTKKGNRPSFTKAAPPDLAVPLYETFQKLLQSKIMGDLQTGVFGADMQVSSVNDGPVTIWIDSKYRE